MRMLTALLLIAATPASAGALTVLVRELGTRDPVPRALVELPALSRTAATDAAGRLELVLDAEAYALVSAEGFAPRGVTLRPGADQARVNLKRAVLQAAPYVVSARKETAAPSRSALKRGEIRRIAGIGRDPLRALQTLPGVVSANDFSGQLAVRGGGPQDNLYFLDRVPWPVPFHYGGAVSTVPSDALDSVDLYPANFPARWGGIDGAVLDARLKRPAKDRARLSLDINLLLAEGLAEGPLGWSSERPSSLTSTPVVYGPPSPDPPAPAPVPTPDAPSRPSWMLGGRRSYFELLLPLVTGNRFQAYPVFWDALAAVDLPLGKRDHLRALYISTEDLLTVLIRPEQTNSRDFEGEFRFRNAYQSGGLTWEHRRENVRNSFTPYAYQVEFETRFGKGYGIRFFPQIAGLKDEAVLDLGGHELTLGGGLEYIYYQVHGYGFRRSSGGGSGFSVVTDPAGITISSSVWERYAYAQDRLKLGGALAMALGLRYSKSDRVAEDSLDPRLALEWKAWEGGRLSAGWGLFTAFPNGQQTSRDFGNPGLSPARTEHLGAGVEQRLGRGAFVRLEAYDKTYRGRVVEVPDSRLYSNNGEGQAKGWELLLKKEAASRWFGWLSYSYSVSERKDSAARDWRLYAYDQPHTATLVGSYDIDPAWSAGLKLTYHSGPLITPVVGRVPDPASTSGWYPVYGEPYSERLPDYLRLDVRTDYAVNLAGWRLNLYLEVINLLNRANPAGVTYSRDFSAREYIHNLPLLPYAGLGAEF